MGPSRRTWKWRGFFQLLRPAYGQGDQRRASQPEKPGVRVFDDPAQLFQDQPWLEFQRGGQGVRDLQQRGLLARAGFHTLVEALIGLDVPADVPDDAQEARPVLIGECRPAPLGVKRRAVPAYVQHPCVEGGAGSKRPEVAPEYILADGVDECRREQSDEFFAGAAVHRAGRRVGLDHAAGFQIGDDQPVDGVVEDAAIMTFFFFKRRVLPARVQEGFLLPSPIA